MNEEDLKEESKSGKRVVGGRKEKTVTKRRFVYPFSCNVFEDFGAMDESESFGNSRGVFCGDSCGFSVCVCVLNVRELVSFVLAQNEPNIDIEQIVMQARGEGH